MYSAFNHPSYFSCPLNTFHLLLGVTSLKARHPNKHSPITSSLSSAPASHSQPYHGLCIKLMGQPACWTRAKLRNDAGNIRERSWTWENLKQKISIQVRICLLLSFRQLIIFFLDISHFAKNSLARFIV